MKDGDLFEMDVAVVNNEEGMTLTFASDAGVTIEVTISRQNELGEQYMVLMTMAEDLPNMIDECFGRLVIRRKAEEG